MVSKDQRKMIDTHLQEDPPYSSHKEASILIMISQGKNSEGLHHKEDHSLPSMKIAFMVIVLFVLILDIMLYIAENMEEMFI
jgi:hypothetical protein